jgi:hypothetical protein
MNWKWRDEGFRSEPKCITAPSGLKVFRAWGGTSKKMGTASSAGVCFSTQRPNTRTEAERLFSVWEWGNPCLWLTEFRVMDQLEIYIGAVDPGRYIDSHLSDPRTGTQVFIENPIQGKVIEVQTVRLVDDLGGRFVVPGSRIWQ